ncbi:MAG: hypothetical protein R3D81_13775 [Thalassovita sp.]
MTDHLTLERTGATVVPFGVGSTELLINTILNRDHGDFLYAILSRGSGAGHCREIPAPLSS